ncbi:MAG: DUF971 domain-containing protein [Actinomycetota bacterium]
MADEHDDIDPHQVTNIDVELGSFVRLTFADGMVATFPVVALRLACPCADCNAKRQRGASVSVLAESKPEEIAISSASMSGAWGLNLDWNDGHTTGIYAFEKLREWADASLIDADVTRPN